jgi:hypothetical protein
LSAISVGIIIILSTNGLICSRICPVYRPGFAEKSIRMKKNSLLFILGIIIISSCQKELTFENADNAGGTGGGNGGGSTVCKACSYVPYCDGSVYSYYDTLLAGSPAVTSDTLQYVKDTTFSGRTYRKFITKGSTTPVYTNCTNGTFRTVLLNVGATGGSIPKIELQMLKDNLAVNGTWNDTIQNGLGQTVIYKNTIKEKAVSRTLHTNTFTDVIHVQADAGVEVPFLGFFITNRSEYYYARGVGLVEALIANEDGTVVYQHRVIKSYNIP